MPLCCKVCQIELTIDNCYVYKGKFKTTCKICYNQKYKEYQQNNKEHVRDTKNKYYKNNKEKVLSKCKEYRASHKEYYSNYEKEWRKNNRARINKKRRERPLTIERKLRNTVSKTILRALKRRGASKNNISFLSKLNYTIKELKTYIESQFEPWMTWENHGNYNPRTWDDNDQTTWTWEIDHIIPQSALPFSSYDDPNFKKCWGLDNLRPLSSKENMEKKDKIIINYDI